MRKILVILGTRPEAIKLAPIILELQAQSEHFISQVCATAQHRQMLDQALAPFGIHPDFDLDIMLPGQTLAQVTSRAVAGLDRIIAQEKPDVILVQGDTTTAFCGALVGYYHRIKVGHVEAGLRTGNKFAPFPEEGNRCLITPLADFHFAPTPQARAALLREAVPDEQIFVTGNTVIDALLWMRAKVEQTPPPMPAQVAAIPDDHIIVLVTGHRRESFGEGFQNICHAIRQVADSFDKVSFVYPVHLNPNVREPVGRILAGHPNIHLIEPMGYEPFVWLMNRATIVLTDSGGVQEEAPSLGKPVLVMRETTERPEGIEAGNAILVGVDQAKIVAELTKLIQSPEERARMANIRNPYGDGTSAKIIVKILKKHL